MESAQDSIVSEDWGTGESCFCGNSRFVENTRKSKIQGRILFIKILFWSYFEYRTPPPG
jgi:hypothetical protein